MASRNVNNRQAGFTADTMRLGYNVNAEPSANEAVIGSNAGPYSNVYFNDKLSVTPDAVVINGAGGSGTDIAGASVSVAGGKGTGTGAGGDFGVATAVPTTTGTTLQSVGDRIKVIAKHKTLVAATATAVARVAIATGTVAGGEFLATVQANDATDYQARTVRCIWSAVNKAGTITAAIATAEEAVAVSAGTLTVAVTVVDAGSGLLDFKLDAASSLTETVLRAQCQVRKNFGAGTVIAQ